MTIEVLKPHMVTKVWGGEKLARLKGLKDASLLPLGETWEVSRHHDGPSQNEKGESLEGLLKFEQLPYLVKFIDTTDNLSIQVHPDDEYAKRVEKSSGKTECWLILESDPGAGIYLGFKDGVTKEQFKKCLDHKDDLSQLMVFYPVQRGDFFFVPAGSIHAIGKGVTLAEIQQSSGVTYRVWDWNRMGLDGKPRELHIDKALDVINFDPKDNTSDTFKVRREVFKEGPGPLIHHRDFVVDLYCLKDWESLKLEPQPQRRASLMCLQGSLEAEGKVLNSYQCALLPSHQETTLMAKEDSSQQTIVLHIY
jgi:mannose-6-phosphate isomerase